MVVLGACAIRDQCPINSTQDVDGGRSKNHVGEQYTVCGKVASARYGATSRGKPTFLNLDEPYRSQVFTILIWGENRDKFGTPEEKYRDKEVCVIGKGYPIPRST
jgi:hypothetical protein